MPRNNPAAKRAYDQEYASRPEIKTRRAQTFAAWRSANKKTLVEREAKRRREKRGQTLVATVRTRAKKRGLAFDLDQHVADIQARIDSGCCELTGQPFDLSPGRRFNSPSIDRIDPAQGYVYANIRVVLNLVNAALGDWGEERLRAVMEAWFSR